MTDAKRMVSLIIPAFNEAGIIRATVAEVQAYMAEHLPDWAYEVLVVDDGSRDGMGDVLRALNDPTVKVLTHPFNRGRGAALRTGYAAAQGDFLVCLDADLSYAPYHIALLLKPLVAGEADISLASAYHPEGKVKNLPWFRAFISRYGNVILRSGVHGRVYTLTCMVRGYRREAIQSLELISNTKDLHIEILQKAELFGLRVVEVPSVLEWRTKDRAKRINAGWMSSFPLFAMSGTIASHLIYNYVLRPGRTLLVPMIILAFVVLVGFITLLGNWIWQLATSPEPSIILRVYETLRETLLQGTLTVSIMVVALAAILTFVCFYFVSQQSKKQFEELYILLARMNDRIKRLETGTQD